MRPDVRARIISSAHIGTSVTNIVRSLKNTFPMLNFCYGTVRREYMKARRRMLFNCTYERKSRHMLSADQMKKIFDAIDSVQGNDPTATATRIYDYLVSKYNLRVSKSYIRRLRLRSGYVKASTRYCQMIRAVNKVARVR